jgi:hypothetical protein
MDINEERLLYLKEELEEYEKVTPMTDDERKALHEWVADGHSVHENGSLGVWDGGAPIDFLDVYRWEQEETEMFNALSEDEKIEFLNERNACSDDIAAQMPDVYEEGETPWVRP